MWDLECVHMPHSDVTQDDRLIKYWSWAKQKTWWPSRCPIPHVINHVCSCTQKLIRLNLSYLVESIIWVNSCTEGSCRGWHCSLGRSRAAKIERVNPTRSSVVTKTKQNKKTARGVHSLLASAKLCLFDSGMPPGRRHGNLSSTVLFQKRTGGAAWMPFPLSAILLEDFGIPYSSLEFEPAFLPPPLLSWRLQ